MKVIKKMTLAAANMTQAEGRDKPATARTKAIKLKAVTNAERQRLRISSYQYILP